MTVDPRDGAAQAGWHDPPVRPTHPVFLPRDLPTAAGWWCERDLDWRGRMGLLGDAAAQQRERDARVRDRNALWDTMRDSGAADGQAPAPSQPDDFADAAVRHVGRSACDLVILPIEDALALSEQPNLPGTMDGHPNWRRRLPGPAATLLDPPRVAARLSMLSQSRTMT